MKKPRVSRSAYTNFRVFLAFTLCLAGFSLAVTAFGAWPDLAAAMRINSQNRSGYEEKLKMKSRTSGGGASKNTLRSMSVKSSSGGGATAPNPATQTQPGNVAQNTVTQYTNPLGQIVYSILPSNFDVSPPLTELARTSVPQLPAEEHPELDLSIAACTTG